MFNVETVVFFGEYLEVCGIGYFMTDKNKPNQLHYNYSEIRLNKGALYFTAWTVIWELIIYSPFCPDRSLLELKRYIYHLA